MEKVGRFDRLKVWRLVDRYAWIQVRMGLLVGFLVMLLVAVVWRGHQLQYIQGAELEGKADRQVSREMKLNARRGSILDRNGVELAVSVDVKSIYANPRFIKDPEVVLGQLKAILGDHLDDAVVLERLKSRRQFVWVARKVSPLMARQVKDLRIPGMGLTSESQRYYPLKDRAGHLIGFVGGDEYKGLEGLERSHNAILEGGTYTLDVTADSRGRKIYLGQEPSFTELEGKSLVLTIDERIQYIAETELSSAIEQSGAASGSLIVSDPKTGDILAMVSYPTFNPNLINDHVADDWRNRATRDAFEPGSTFKSFVVASALQEGVVTLDDAINVNGGTLRFGDDVITDHHRAQFMTVRDVVKHSSNIGAYRLAKRLERERFGWYIQQFGFSEATGIGIPEQKGRMRDPKKWPEISLANVAFGHGLTVTNLQMNMGLGAIANGGTLMKPRLIKEIRDRTGALVESFPTEARRQVLSREASARATESLMSVVETGGTGVEAGMAYYKVAGKTGTARKVDSETRQYSNRLWTASFVGFVPADDPALVITVIVNIERDYRGQAYYGGKVSAPVFSRVAAQALPMLGVFPSAEAVRAEARKSPAVEPSVAVSLKAGSGVVEDRTMVPPQFVNGVEAPEVEPGLSVMPSYVDLSVRQALSVSREHGHIVQTSGTGKVKRQWPGPGVFVGEDVVVQLEFAAE